jgi:YesN/AraC family two-component response regulator
VHKKCNSYTSVQATEEEWEEEEETATEPATINNNAAEAELLEKVALLINEQQLYADPGLSLTELSVATKTGLHVLSRLINTQSGQNFNEYINSFRINAIIEKMKAGYHHKTTLMVSV